MFLHFSILGSIAKVPLRGEAEGCLGRVWQGDWFLVPKGVGRPRHPAAGWRGRVGKVVPGAVGVVRPKAAWSGGRIGLARGFLAP